MVNTSTFNHKFAIELVTEIAPKLRVSRTVSRDVIEVFKTERNIYDISEGIMNACEIGTEGVREFETICLNILNSPYLYPQFIDRPFSVIRLDKQIVFNKLEYRITSPGSSSFGNLPSEEQFSAYYKKFTDSFVDEFPTTLNMAQICEMFIRSFNYTLFNRQNDEYRSCLRALYIDTLYVIDEMTNNTQSDIVVSNTSVDDIEAGKKKELEKSLRDLGIF